MTWIEATAAIFGLICVGLTVRQNIWCWPTGLVQVTLYIVVFYRAKLYSDMILHVIYVGMQIYGWHHWLRGGTQRNTLPVSLLSSKARLGWAMLAMGGTCGWGFLMATLTDASVPYLDAFITVSSLIAHWLMARKRLESWLLWISVDVVAIGIYWYKELTLTCGLYAVFLVLASIGFCAWRKSLLQIRDEDRIDTREVRPIPPRASVVD